MMQSRGGFERYARGSASREEARQVGGRGKGVGREPAGAHLRARHAGERCWVLADGEFAEHSDARGKGLRHPGCLGGVIHFDLAGFCPAGRNAQGAAAKRGVHLRNARGGHDEAPQRPGVRPAAIHRVIALGLRHFQSGGWKETGVINESCK